MISSTDGGAVRARGGGYDVSGVDFMYIYNLYLSLFLMTYAAGQFNWIPVCLLRTLQALQIKQFQRKISLF